MQKLMLYYHIPFCRSKCAYCAFYSFPCSDTELMDSYTEALIKQTAEFEDADDYTVTSVYFGGGTPSVLGADRLTKVLGQINKVFTLSLDAEITVEVNPCTIDLQGLSLLRSAGVNRLSIGAQSFNDRTLKLLNRAHNSKDFERCYYDARSVGFDNISADLIFALPNENLADFSGSVKKLISLAPEHISVYGLSIEEGTALWTNRELYTFPTEDEEEEQHDALCALLADNGYIHYEISNFAKPNMESRHNSGYWKRLPYFGFGSGAHSFFENRRFDTKRNIHAYIENTALSFTAPTSYAASLPLTTEEAEEERIMLGLRLAEGIEIKKPVPQILLGTGLVKFNGEKICLTEKGFRLSNSIIRMLI